MFHNSLLLEIGFCDRTQETFARKNNEKKNALASTHLICCEPGSQKYNAALKWGLPAVNHEWLLACAREGRQVSEEPYLVGESSCKNATSFFFLSLTKSKLCYDQWYSWSVCLGVKHPSVAQNQIFITVKQLKIC